MSRNLKEQIAEKEARILKICNELSESHFPPTQVESIECYRLPQSFGVSITTSSSEDVPIIVDTVTGEVKVRREGNKLTCIIPVLDEKSVKIQIGHSAPVEITPGNLHKKVLPDLLKTEYLHFTIVDKSHLGEILALTEGPHKKVQKDDKTYHFDASLDWLIEEDDRLTVFGVSDKYGLLQKMSKTLKLKKPLKLYERLIDCLQAEVSLLSGLTVTDNVTKVRRELTDLERESDEVAFEIST